jgi:hypothetical protein
MSQSELSPVSSQSTVQESSNMSGRLERDHWEWSDILGRPGKGP